LSIFCSVLSFIPLVIGHYSMEAILSFIEFHGWESAILGAFSGLILHKFFCAMNRGLRVLFPVD
jgi:hypothetical protein